VDPVTSVIERVTVTEFEYRLPGEGSDRPAHRRFAVRIDTSTGAQGGYVPLWSAPPYALPQVLDLANRVVGMGLGERERIWDLANHAHSKLDRIGASAIDIALWDALGKETGRPIADLLGRYRSRLPAYASSTSGRSEGDELSSPQGYADFTTQCKQQHFKAFKIHGISGGNVSDEIAVLRAVAAAAGPEMDVMTDPGKNLTSWADALRLGRTCDEVGAFWLEDPMRDNAGLGHRMLRERIRTPILITEMVRGLEMRAELALSGATDFLRADPELDMGITGVMKTAHFAEAIGLDCEVHAAGPAQRHCMAAIRNTNYYELGLLHPTKGNAMLPPVFAGDYREDARDLGEDGCVAVPEGPGLGVNYDWERIDGRAVAVHSSTY
jgi:L-alanine-DL-glutamate epimerase-like enolase superfamily enzyme